MEMDTQRIQSHGICEFTNKTVWATRKSKEATRGLNSEEQQHCIQKKNLNRVSLALIIM